jgi:hypothetical protein
MEMNAATRLASVNRLACRAGLLHDAKPIQ